MHANYSLPCRSPVLFTLKIQFHELKIESLDEKRREERHHTPRRYMILFLFLLSFPVVSVLPQLMQKDMCAS